MVSTCQKVYSLQPLASRFPLLLLTLAAPRDGWTRGVGRGAARRGSRLIRQGAGTNIGLFWS
jgi:hypothetical protein